MNTKVLAAVIFGGAMVGAAQAASVSDAQNVSVTPAVRAQAQQVSRQYTGRSCKSDIELQREDMPARLSEEQIRSARQALYPSFVKEMDTLAKDNGLEYQVRYDHSHIWSWMSKKGNPEHYFMLLTIGPSKFEVLSCLN